MSWQADFHHELSTGEIFIIILLGDSIFSLNNLRNYHDKEEKFYNV